MNGYCVVCGGSLYCNTPTCEVCGGYMCNFCYEELRGLCSKECYEEAERLARSDLQGEEFEIAHRATH